MITPVNTSGIAPLGRAVLVQCYEPEMRASSIVLPDSVKESRNVLEQRAVVVAVGPACWPDEPARAKPGDRVLIARFTGHVAKSPIDGTLWRVVNDNDIFAAITHEE